METKPCAQRGSWGLKAARSEGRTLVKAFSPACQCPQDPLHLHKHFYLVNRISLGTAWSCGAGDTWRGRACSLAGTVPPPHLPPVSALCPDSTPFKNSSHISEFLLRAFTFYPQTKHARCGLCVLCRDADCEERGTISPSPVTALVALVCLLRVLSLYHPQHIWSTAVPPCVSAASADTGRPCGSVNT